MGNIIEIAEKCVLCDEYIVFSSFMLLAVCQSIFSAFFFFSQCAQPFGEKRQEKKNL